MKTILITQCLQNDFVQPIERFDPIPNRLHIGYHEARRLMGENPAEGPVARTMAWAYEAPGDQPALIHIRDCHDQGDDSQATHLELFGHHCIKGTPGAEFAFSTDFPGAKKAVIIDSPGLNDFQGTGLTQALEPYRGQSARVGIMGVWTEAKVAFLAYEIRTRYPEFDLAVCSALTASSSRQHHFNALDQLERILGVRVIHSVGDFIEYLGGARADAPLTGIRERFPVLEMEGPALAESDRTLIRYLFRDCRKVELKVLDGGFSGNVVAGARGEDLHGHQQAPHVVKVGPRDLIGRERMSFEQIQEVLGNNAPHISDFADWNDRGAIKYRYASMGGTQSTTFQKRYRGGAGLDEIRRILDEVFGEQLMRLYRAADLESCDLLEHYMFSTRWAPSVRKKVEALAGGGEGPLELSPGIAVGNVCDFYENLLADPSRRRRDHCYQAYVHGDLNGANIILDGHGNVWLIDFFHTRRAHVLMDLIKLENDLLYIFTPVAGDPELREGMALIDGLMGVEDLAAPLPDRAPSGLPQMARAWETVKCLRGFYPTLIRSDRDPFQLHVAQMRYAVHTLGFDESSLWQRRLALYTASRCAEKISEGLSLAARLRLDWIDSPRVGPGRLAVTLLPGRKDFGRDLCADIAVIREEGISGVLCLVPREELERYGVGRLLEAYRESGLEVFHLPLVDQKVSAVSDMLEALRWVDGLVKAGRSALAHCVGGLGRSGMAAAAYLTAKGERPDEAIDAVRKARSPRAVETAEQEAFVRDFPRGGL